VLATRPCFVLTRSGRLAPPKLVFINDAPSKGVELLSGSIGADAGRRLGCTSVRDELAQRCEAPGGFGFGGEEFGQKEALRDRIRGLLHDYNSRADVLTEHWQNVDDTAGGFILFCLDLASYEKAGLVDKRTASLQGPALLLASSHALSDGDIVRMERLGTSGKRDDFGSAGRFGVGLNCMYHMADAFTLHANGALHVFDPCGLVVARGAETGKAYTLTQLQERFPAMLQPFEWIDVEAWPTVFRLPLRSTASDIGQAVSPVSLLAQLEAFATTAQELLLFSKHVRGACFVHRAANGVQSQLANLNVLSASIPVSDALQLMSSLPTTLEEMQ